MFTLLYITIILPMKMTFYMFRFMFLFPIKLFKFIFEKSTELVLYVLSILGVLVIAFCIIRYCWPLILIFLVICIWINKKYKAYKDYKYRNVDFDSMDGKQFEHYCAYLLEKDGFRDVNVTKASGDHGIDILAKKDNLSYAIQCKRYSGSVGNKAVQEAFTGKALYHADIAVVITNSTFTKQAIEDAQSLGVELWDKKFLLKYISPEKRVKYDERERMEACGKEMVDIIRSEAMIDVKIVKEEVVSHKNYNYIIKCNNLEEKEYLISQQNRYREYFERKQIYVDFYFEELSGNYVSISLIPR